jgi:ATP synthase F1 epsilon subunit
MVNKLLLYLKIITPYKKIFSGKINSLTVNTSRGEMQVLPMHEAIMELLHEGALVIIDQENLVKKFMLKSGILKVNNNKCTILTDNITMLE